MNSTSWIAIGLIAAGIAGFAIPYGFYLKTKENRGSKSIRTEQTVQNSPHAETYQVGRDLSIKKEIHGDNVAGDKNIYYYFIQNEIAKTDKGSIVTEEEIRDFFLKFQLSLSRIRESISPEALKSLPGYLQRPYDINVTISKTHGVGFEFISPSKNPEINISTTNMPIEQYYFSKYTDKEEFSKKTIFHVGARYLAVASFMLEGGKKAIALEQNADILLRNIGIKYSKDDTIKEIEFLRLFGSNQKDYWNKINPEEQAKYLFNVK